MAKSYMAERAHGNTLAKALRHTQEVLHGTTCQGESDCVEACESARDTYRDHVKRRRDA